MMSVKVEENETKLTCFDLNIANMDRHIGRRITAALTLMTDADPRDRYKPI